MCDEGEWATKARKAGRNTGERSGVCVEEGRPLPTLSSMRTGIMPKKGLIAMAGRISAPSSEGRGAMQMPPVSMGMTGKKCRWAAGLVPHFSRPSHRESGTDWLGQSGWDCRFGARKQPPLSQGLFSETKLDLDPGLLRCGLGVGPGRGLRPRCRGSTAPRVLLSSSRPRWSRLRVSGRGGAHLLAQEDEESLLDQSPKQRSQKPTILCRCFSSLCQPAWQYLTGLSGNLSPVPSRMDEN